MYSDASRGGGSRNGTENTAGRRRRAGGLRCRLPPADGTGTGGRIVEATTLRTLLFVILLIPPYWFDRMTAIGKELIDDVVTGITG